MFNFCLFIFVLYAVSNSAKAILFGNKRRKRKAIQHRNVRSNTVKRRNNIIYANTQSTCLERNSCRQQLQIKHKKAGRKGNIPMRPVLV